MNEVMNTILHRRSIRRFEPKQIEETALQPRKEGRVIRIGGAAE